MKQIQGLLALNTLLICILLYLVIDLRKTVSTDYQVAAKIAGQVEGPLAGLQTRIQQADQISHLVQQRFEQVGRALESQNSPPPKFQQVPGVLSAENTSQPSTLTPTPVERPLQNAVTDIQISNEIEKDGIVELSGIAPDNQTIASYMQQLSQQGSYESIDLVESRQAPDGKKLFILRATRGH